MSCANSLAIAASMRSSCSMPGWAGVVIRRWPRGEQVVYGPAVEEVLLKIWEAAEQPCGKRLVELLGLWLPYYNCERGKLTSQTLKKVLRISPAQVDRLLAPHKARVQHRGRCGTKPGGLLKHHIPIRTDHWDVSRPGYLEADTVAHCGASLEGDFIWSVTYTDIYSGWTSLRLYGTKRQRASWKQRGRWSRPCLLNCWVLIVTTAASFSTGIWYATFSNGSGP